MNKNILLVSFLLVFSSFIWGQVVPEDVYRKADSALADNSIPKLNSLLSSNTGAPWYPRLESYLLKKSRQLIIENKFEEAKAIALVLIDNNLDNKEAVDLYQSVQTTIAKRDTEQKKVTEQQSVSSFKQAATETKIKQDIAKTYKTATNTATGKKVYLDQDFNNTYRSYTWDAMLGLANASFILEPSDKNLKYGLSASGSFFYHGEDFKIGADIIGDGMILTFLGKQNLNWSGQALASLTANKISKYLELRAGYAVFGYETQFSTPVVGLGFRDVKSGETGRFQLAFDYYPGHLNETDMSFAAGVNLGFSSVLAKMGNFNIQLFTGLNDTVLLYSSGIKNDLKLRLAIGVGNYE